MLGDKMIESVCIVRMNNSKINIIKKLRRVLICNNKRVSMCNCIRKITVRKKVRSRSWKGWFNECRQGPVRGMSDRPMRMRNEFWSRRRSRCELVHRRDGNR